LLVTILGRVAFQQYERLSLILSDTAMCDFVGGYGKHFLWKDWRSHALCGKFTGAVCIKNYP